MKTQSYIRHYFSGKQLFFLIVIIFCSFYAKAGIETSNNSLTGSAVVKLASVTAVDNKYTFIQANSSTWKNTFKIASAVGRVRVGFDHTSLTYVSTAYDYTFYLKIEYQDSGLSAATAIYRQLTAKYDPSAAGAYQDAGLYEVNTTGVIWIKATIDSIHDNTG